MYKVFIFIADTKTLIFSSDKRDNFRPNRNINVHISGNIFLACVGVFISTSIDL